MNPASDGRHTSPAGRPLTDAFGTRLDPESILAGLRAQGLPQPSLEASDEGLLVRHAPADELSVMRASTWLKTLVSPLVPTRFEGLEVPEDRPPYLDARTRGPTPVLLGEAFSPEHLPAVLESLLSRLEPGPSAPFEVLAPEAPAEWTEPLASLKALLAETFPGRVSLSLLVEAPTGPRLLSPGETKADAHLLLWQRRGGETGIRPALILALSREATALQGLVGLLEETPSGPLPDLLIDGLVWAAGRRPTIAAPVEPARHRLQILVDPERCTECGLCSEVCPTGYLGASGLPTEDESVPCVRCFDCVEACPQDALRPALAPDSATLSLRLEDRPGWLSRLRGVPGPAVPAPFPPSYLLPKKKTEGAPRYVLGLAIATMQEHAAALVKDGELVGAIEEERLVRRRHHGWSPEGRHGVTICVDPRIQLEEALCRRSVRVLLEKEGIGLDEVDVFALNGIPARWRQSYSLVDESKPPSPVRAGRVLALPHHLTHAASSYRASGLESAWVFTVDGRGDRETAALARAEKGEIRRVYELLSYTVRSIGGTYETVTRTLGFGSHGQGSTMALAALGEPRYDFTPFLSVRSLEDLSIDEPGPGEAFAPLARRYEDPITQEHKDLAASLQHALETSIETLLRQAGVPEDADALCLAGGVILNCKMNGGLRERLRPRAVFAQPGANDAGTALGAALEGWYQSARSLPAPMPHAYLGPAFEDSEIESVLRRSGLAYRRLENVEEETARILSEGQVLCWFQGRMEFGPRALGSRSILADPRRPELKERVNRIKDRQDWRPFAPSILAGHENEWFENAFDSPYMLFAVRVKEDKRPLAPVIVHDDGSTRPQVVHSETHPRYHRMISAFHRLTGVPLVVNTSFNRRGEPIVCTPKDALESFRGLAVDALVIGSFLVTHAPAAPRALPSEESLAALPRGRRLLLRLNAEPDTGDELNPLRDLAGLPERSSQEALLCLAEGREAGCDELVIMRGEATRRPDLPALVQKARRMGYRSVQIQTSGRPLAQPQRLQALLAAGVDAFEIPLFASDEASHDRIARSPGAFRETVSALQTLSRSGKEVLLILPVLRENRLHLGRMVQIAQKLGLKRVQFYFPRPVELSTSVPTDSMLRLPVAAALIRRASAQARELGLSVSVEGMPFCQLEPWLWSSPDAEEDFTRHRIDDLHLVHDSAAEARRVTRAEPPGCRPCSQRERCPKTWSLYQELFGTGELVALGR